MKSLLFFLTLLFLAGSADGQTARGSGEKAIRIGISSRTFDKINRNDAAAALKAWGGAVAREQNLTEQIDVELYDVFEELRDDFLAGRLEAVSITAMDFLRMEIVVDWIFVLATDRGAFVEYVLIVHRDGGLEILEALEERRILLYQGQRMDLARHWLESLQTKLADGPDRPLWSDAIEMRKSSEAIFQIFFRQADAAVVSRESFRLARELNPQLGERLKTLAVSPPFIPAFFIFRPSFEGPRRKRLESAILELHATPGGRQVLTTFQSAKMVKRPFSVLAGTLEFLNEHRPGLDTRSGTGERP